MPRELTPTIERDPEGDWQFAWTATPLSYLDPIFQGACVAAHDLVSWPNIPIRSREVTHPVVLW